MNLKRTDIREETSGTTGKHHWNKEPRLKKAKGTSGRIFRKTMGLETVK
jgi:hypothetical protein